MENIKSLKAFNFSLKRCRPALDTFCSKLSSEKFYSDFWSHKKLLHCRFLHNPPILGTKYADLINFLCIV